MNKTSIIYLSLGIALIGIHSAAIATDANTASTRSGVLDEPLVNPNPVPPFISSTTLEFPTRDPDLESTDPNIRQEAVQAAVEEEIEELEGMQIDQVEARAEAGERAAQVVLGTDFAREANSLSSVPALANQAAEDAVRWYSEAARRGYPGAPSLNYAGVSFHPIRVQREPN